jgi:arsenite methyltransferase
LKTSNVSGIDDPAASRRVSKTTSDASLKPSMRPGGILLTERALDFCSLRSGSRVIDVGCGAGETLKLLEGAGVSRPVGLDPSERFLEEAHTRLESTQLIRGRAETLPFKDLLFDALFCECVLSILEDGTRAPLEWARVLKRGGFLILSDVFTKNGRSPASPEPHSQPLPAHAPLVKGDLLRLLEGLGFVVLLWEEHENLLKEFAARMILAGLRLPDSWCFGQGWKTGKGDGMKLSYFLLVGRKGKAPASSTSG